MERITRRQLCQTVFAASVAEDARVARGIAWLKASQRESGRWFTHPLLKDNKHYVTLAGVAMAVLALTSCGVTE